MSNVPESTAKIQQEAVQFLAAASESTMTGIGAAINYCLTRTELAHSILLKQQDFGVGTTPWVAPTNLVGGFVIFIGVGGGGGGGAGDSTFSAQGGGGSGTAFGPFTGIIPGNSYNVVVGAGGTAGTSAGPGGSGGNTSFNGTTIGIGGSGGRGGTLMGNAASPPSTGSFLNSVFGPYGLAGTGGTNGYSVQGSNGAAGSGAASGGVGGLASASGTAGQAGTAAILWFENPVPA